MTLRNAIRLVSPTLPLALIGFVMLAGGCAHGGRTVHSSSPEAPAVTAATDSIEALGESIRAPVRFLTLEPDQSDNSCLTRGQARIVGTLPDEDVKLLAAYARRLSGLPVILVQGTSRRAEVHTGIGCGPLQGHGDIFQFEKRNGEWGENKNGWGRRGWAS